MADQELADAILNGIDAIEGGLNETSRLYDGVKSQLKSLSSNLASYIRQLENKSGTFRSTIESLEDRNAKLSRDKEALTAKQKGFEEKLDCNNQETQTLRDENKQLKAEISQALFDHRNRTQVRAGTASGSNARMELEHEIHMLRLEKNQISETLARRMRELSYFNASVSSDKGLATSAHGEVLARSDCASNVLSTVNEDSSIEKGTDAAQETNDAIKRLNKALIDESHDDWLGAKLNSPNPCRGSLTDFANERVSNGIRPTQLQSVRRHNGRSCSRALVTPEAAPVVPTTPSLSSPGAATSPRTIAPPSMKMAAKRILSPERGTQQNKRERKGNFSPKRKSKVGAQKAQPPHSSYTARHLGSDRQDHATNANSLNPGSTSPNSISTKKTMMDSNDILPSPEVRRGSSSFTSRKPAVSDLPPSNVSEPVTPFSRARYVTRIDSVDRIAVAEPALKRQANKQIDPRPALQSPRCQPSLEELHGAFGLRRGDEGTRVTSRGRKIPRYQEQFLADEGFDREYEPDQEDSF